MLYRVDASGLIQILGDMAARIEDMTPLWTKATAIARAAFASNFAMGGDPAWAPLRPSTLRDKMQQNLPGGLRTKSGRIPLRLMQNGMIGPETILIRTGYLRDSLAQRGAPGNVTQISRDGAFAGTSVPYAIYHELGTSKMVARPMTTMRDSDVEELNKAALEYLFGAAAFAKAA